MVSCLVSYFVSHCTIVIVLFRAAAATFQQDQAAERPMQVMFLSVSYTYISFGDSNGAIATAVDCRPSSLRELINRPRKSDTSNYIEQKQR